MTGFMRRVLKVGSLAGLIVLAAHAQEAEEEVAPPPPEVDPAEALAPLESAYQKEVAYLLAEKEGLERRVRDQARRAETQRADARATLDRLDGRLTALQVQSERAETQLADIDRRATEAQEAGDALSAAWFQARSSLDAEALGLPELGAEQPMSAFADAFGRAFEAGAAEVTSSGAVRVTDGTFFDVGGAERQGRIVTVGRIATFGITGDEAFALLPTGEGRLQAWRHGGGATGRALAAGTTEPTMGLFLHEGRSNRIEDRPPKGFEHVVEAGGTVGIVIIGLGALALVLMVLRTLTLLALGRGQGAVDAAVAHVARRDVAAAKAAVERGGSAPTRVVAAILPTVGRERAIMEDVANEALLYEVPRVERFESAILVAAAVAPLLGLLGTVTGMIATFDIITEFGTGDPKMLSGGISEALVTTQLGLVVAIPALLGGNLLSGWGQAILARTENSALRVLNALVDEPDAASPDTPDGSAA